MSEVITMKPTFETLGPDVIKNHVDELLSKQPKSFEELIYIPNWENKPPETKDVLSLNGVPVLTYKNVSTLIAGQGFGKSSCCDAIAANFVNPKADCLTWQVSDEVRGVLAIDMERTPSDTWKGFSKIYGRAGKPYGYTKDNFTIAGLRDLPRLEQRMKAIEYLINRHPCDLLIFDGFADLVNDPNDQPECIELRAFIRETAATFNLSIFGTLHPNPGSLKPRGHIGSEFMREAETVLALKKYDGDVRIITTDFEHGKSRNSGGVTAAYKWSDEHHMFITADIDDAIIERENKKAEKLKQELSETLNNVLPKLKALTREQLEREVSEFIGKSKSTASRKINEMLKFKLVSKSEDGNYRNIA